MTNPDIPGYPEERNIRRFRKRPVVIEAIPASEIILGGDDLPDWLVNAELNGTVEVYGDRVDIRTLEGTMTADPGDWIICGVKGELYPCKPEIFEATYERP
ncbi:MAG TPA: hypothetical protein VGH66_07985 [Acidimicrobiales bacterium]|jgi:hypothetical protein